MYIEIKTEVGSFFDKGFDAQSCLKNCLIESEHRPEADKNQLDLFEVSRQTTWNRKNHLLKRFLGLSKKVALYIKDKSFIKNTKTDQVGFSLKFLFLEGIGQVKWYETKRLKFPDGKTALAHKKKLYKKHPTQTRTYKLISKEKLKVLKLKRVYSKYKELMTQLDKLKNKILGSFYINSQEA